jgi:phosphoserine phosphatase
MSHTHALVLTATPGALDDAVAARARELLGANAAPPRWLAPATAADILFTLGALDQSDLLGRLRAGQTGPIDVNIVPLRERRKRLLMADMDSTIIQQECIDEMADLFGLKERIAAITERAMRGELDFEAALKERLGLLAGLDEAGLEKVWAERIVLMPGAKALIATMRANGAYTALVSGGFTFFTAKVARTVGFDANRANQLEFSDGRLTGHVVGPILGREAKLAALQELAGLRGLPMSATLAVGDGANDLDMVRAAGLGVAYRAKPKVAAEAAAAITHGDLTALLYLQGYAQSEFVAV